MPVSLAGHPHTHAHQNAAWKLTRDVINVSFCFWVLSAPTVSYPAMYGQERKKMSHKERERRQPGVTLKLRNGSLRA